MTGGISTEDKFFMGHCIFCNAPDLRIFEIDTGKWAVVCPQCGAIGPQATTSEIAVSRWNGATIHA